MEHLKASGLRPWGPHVVAHVHICRFQVGIQRDARGGTVGHKDLGDGRLAHFPNLCWNATHLAFTILVFEFEDQRHDQPPDVAEGDFIVLLPTGQKGLLVVTQFGYGLCSFLTVQLEHLVLACGGVEVVQGGVGFQVGLRNATIRVAHLRDVFRFALVCRLAQRRFHIGVARFHLQPLDVFHGDVAVVRGVEPSAPEPVQIHPRRILQGPEEICR